MCQTPVAFIFDGWLLEWYNVTFIPSCSCGFRELQCDFHFILFVSLPNKPFINCAWYGFIFVNRCIFGVPVEKLHKQLIYFKNVFSFVTT